MIGQRKELPPKLEQDCIEGTHYYARKRRNKKKFGFLFIFTLCVGIVSLILFAFSNTADPEMSVADRIAQFIVSKEFMDISINNKSEAPEGDDLYSSILDFIDSILIPPKTPEQTENTSQTVSPPLSKDTLYEFDYSKVPTGEIPIVPMNLALSSYGNGYFHNDTAKKIDSNVLLGSKLDLLFPTQAYPQSAPTVLIVHTHGTESYSENGAISFLDNKSELARSDNENENVVALGKVISEVLNKKGINTVHCTIMHDKTQYKDAYKRSEETIKEYLKKYPSIKMVIDVHRDSILKSTGELVRPVTEVDGKAAAQLMCVVGGSDSAKYCQQNLTLSMKIREALNSEYNDLCRPPYLKASTYNQDLVPYSILLEAGASGNSLEEAKLSVALFAEALAKQFGTI